MPATETVSSKPATPPAPPAAKPLTVTVQRAIEISGLSERTLYREMENGGALRSRKVRGRRLIIYASLEKLLDPDNEAAIA